ncbi:MAG: TIGR03118 family protein [Pseudomonadota bacterium]
MFHRIPGPWAPLTRALAIAFACAAPVTAAQASGYVQTNLVANHAKYNPIYMVDPYLVNPWGIALRPPGAGGHIWTSNAGTGTTTTYIGDVVNSLDPGKLGQDIPLYQDGLRVVPIVTSALDMDPDTLGADQVAQVTGQVYNAASDIAGQPVEFYVEGPAINYSDGSNAGIDAGSAKFIFVTQDGTINAWRTKTDPGMLEAVVVKDFWTEDHEAQGFYNRPGFNGVAMTTDAWTLDANGNKVADNRLYVADFANARVMTFDNQWNEITSTTPFAKPADLIAPNWSPFNVQVLSDNRIYVAWTQSSFEIDEPTEEIPGPGMGRIVAYDRDGNMLQDYTAMGLLNNPWGMAIAPDSFGEFAGALLVANFGDGTIAAFDVDTGAELGYLRDPDGNIITIDGIWGLTFGNGWSLGDETSLYFTAGPDEERDGILGRLDVAAAPVPEPETWAMLLAGLGLVGFMARRKARRG